MLGHQGPNSALRPETQPPSALLRFLICIKWMIIIWGGSLRNLNELKWPALNTHSTWHPGNAQHNCFPTQGADPGYGDHRQGRRWGVIPAISFQDEAIQNFGPENNHFHLSRIRQNFQVIVFRCLFRPQLLSQDTSPAPPSTQVSRPPTSPRRGPLHVEVFRNQRPAACLLLVSVCEP